VSRGTDPDSEIPALVVDGLRAHGEDVSAVQPVGLSAADSVGAIMFVVFDVDVRSTIVGDADVRRWDGLPMVMEDFEVAYDAISARVSELVPELMNWISPSRGERALARVEVLFTAEASPEELKAFKAHVMQHEISHSGPGAGRHGQQAVLFFGQSDLPEKLFDLEEWMWEQPYIRRAFFHYSASL
jgi:hypothetical protein